MERTAWTDDRLDDRMSAIDKNFDRLFLELRDLRVEMRAEFAAVRADHAALRESLAATQRQMTRIVAGLAIGLLGVLLAAVLTQH